MGATTKRPNLPEKEYYLRSKDKQAPIVIESSSEDEVEDHESMYALFAGEISFSDAVTGPDSNEWKDAIYEEIKSLKPTTLGTLLNDQRIATL